MKITAKSRYAVTALSDIALRQGNGPVPLSDVGQRQGISLPYLEQIFVRLRRAGLVSSVRGVSGGYALATPADTIRVAHIVSAVNEEIRTTACTPGTPGGCRGTDARCLTHDLWDALGEQIGHFLDTVTLEDIIRRRIPRRPPPVAGSTLPEAGT